MPVIPAAAEGYAVFHRLRRLLHCTPEEPPVVTPRRARLLCCRLSVCHCLYCYAMMMPLALTAIRRAVLDTAASLRSC